LSAVEQAAEADVYDLVRQLQAREAELALIHQTAGIGAVEVSLRQGFKNRRSPEYLKIHGLPPTAFNEPHDEWLARIHPDDRQRVEQQFLDSVAGTAIDYATEYRIIRPSDGQTRWVRVAARIERESDGRPIRLLGAHADVTDAKLAEQALRESEERFRTIADSAPIPMWMTKLDGERLFVNQAYCAFFGVSYEHALILDWRDRVHPDDADAILKAEQLRELVRPSPPLPNNPFALEFRIERIKGDWRWIKAVSQPRFDELGNHMGFIGVAHDISVAKQAEIELSASEERFRLMAESAPVMIWISDPNGRCVHLNQMLREFWGLAEQQVADFDWGSTLHPDDAALALGRVSSALEKRSHLTLKCRYLDAKGRYRTLETRAHPRFAADGEFIGMVGANVDVTEREQAEKARELLVDELNHRVKNTLAIVQAIAHRTFRKDSNPTEARQAFEGRLVALGHAHDLLTSANWENASLIELAETALDTKGANAGAVSLAGPPVLLSPKQAVSMAMALHELCTNARKYGALSRDEGRVRVEWSQSNGEQPELRIVWHEIGGPPVYPPVRQGFGSTLLERTLARDLDGQVKADFEPGGLRCQITLPLDRLDLLPKTGP
jgi:PAS domain S-box-containing protein